MLPSFVVQGRSGNEGGSSVALLTNDRRAVVAPSSLPDVSSNGSMRSLKVNQSIALVNTNAGVHARSLQTVWNMIKCNEKMK